MSWTGDEVGNDEGFGCDERVGLGGCIGKVGAFFAAVKGAGGVSTVYRLWRNGKSKTWKRVHRTENRKRPTVLMRCASQYHSCPEMESALLLSRSRFRLEISKSRL